MKLASFPASLGLSPSSALVSLLLLTIVSRLLSLKGCDSRA